MQCPECKIEARITKVRKEVNVEERKMYRIMTYSCQNKKCPNFNQEIDTVRVEEDGVIFT